MALAVVMFSTSSIFVRWAAPLNPLTITAGRMLFSSLTVVVISLALRRNWRPPPPADRRRYWLYGLIAAAHFGFYNASLFFTTIAHALSITYTAPIWVTLFSSLVLKEPFPKRKWPGMAIAVAGIAILAGFEPTLDGRMVVGDLLALGSAICFGLYSVAGRRERGKAPLFTYAASVYGIAALWMLVPGWLAYRPGTLTWQSFLAVLGASIVPLGIGHTLYNAALRRLHPTIVNVMATQEVTGGVLLGMMLLNEFPGWTTLAGALVALLGVIWTLM